MRHTCSHNPYFSRWFSAIRKSKSDTIIVYDVTILILVDGFLQYNITDIYSAFTEVTILILVDGFLQCSLGDVQIIME